MLPFKLIERTRTSPYRSWSRETDILAGWRIHLPIFAKRRMAYDINRDEHVEGRWVFTLALSVNPLGAEVGRCHGGAVRLTWGWINWPRPTKGNTP